MVRTSLGALQIKMGKENLEKAVEAGRNYQANDSVEMESEEKRYLELSRQKIAEGNYEEAQKLMEELSLRRTNYINRRTKINLADKEKQATIEEYRRKQEEIESITKKIESLAMNKKDDKAGAASQGEDEIKRLETEKNNKRRELQVYLTGLKKTHPDIAALLGAKPIELATIQEQLSEDTAILQYLMLPDKLVVFVIKRSGIDTIETPIKKAVLKDKVESLRKAICAKTEGKDSKRIKPLSKELHDMLIKPLEETQKLKGIHVIGIAPNGFLHQLPFGVLMNSLDRDLIDRYILFYINSTSLLGVALDRGRQKTKGENTLLALSNPDGSLPSADIEVTDIAKLFSRKQIYSRNEAKKSVIQADKKDYSILHFSTHGIFDPIDSTKSHLIMADSDLTIEDIWGLPLKGINLTVLSACETGIGEVLSGDDVVSLENAFIYAGSPTVIATLWKVADQSTAELMSLFYQNLFKGKTKAEALTEAQRKLKEKYDHPFFWAAFTLRGDWR
jgi:CHAT domain-containing protein